MAITTLTNDGNCTLADMRSIYDKHRSVLLTLDAMNEDETKVIKESCSLLEYVQYVQNYTQKHAMEYDLQVLAQFLSMRIYIFTQDEDTNEFKINNTRTVSLFTKIFP